MTYKIKHIAFIMDGNQRWAKINKKSKQEGYIQGFKNINNILDCCIDHNINNITLYAASAENLKRTSSNLLFAITRKYFKKFIKDINNKKVKINIIGERENIPLDILDLFDNIKINKDFKIKVNVAFNYGTQCEIKNIFEKMITNKNDITLENIRSNMYLGDSDDPDILVRTGGFQRLSNFILLNLSYTELFFTKTLWPDFTNLELNDMIKEFSNLKRNY